MAADQQEWTLAALPRPLQRYVRSVAVAGPLVAIIAAFIGGTHLTRESWMWLVLLVALAIVAERFPVHLTHKVNLNVGTAVYLAMIFLLPSGLPGVVALAATVLAQVWRRSLLFEAVFNVGQTVMYVTATTVAFHAIRPLGLGPPIGSIGPVSAVVVASIALHLSNTALVAVAGALQLGLKPFRVWWTNLGIDLIPHTVLTGLGAIAALVISTQPLYLPFVIIPAVLVHHSVKQMTELRVDTHEALVSLVEVIELRDPYTAGHSYRVAAISRILAQRLGMTAEEADVIEQAGHVHDLGKAATDMAILTKPGKLTDAEWAEMRLHPLHGANVIERFGVFHQVALLVRHHHESMDGQGYPDGLAGEEIPFGSRILSVADTFDALTTNRPYRKGKSIEEAMAILESGAGRQWDARIVEVMCEWLRSTGGEVPTYRPAPRDAEAA